MTCPPCSRRASRTATKAASALVGVVGGGGHDRRRAAGGAGCAQDRRRQVLVGFAECFAPALRPVATRTDAARRPLAAGRQLERTTWVAGCGIGDSPLAADLLARLFARRGQAPLVLDADGLNLLRARPGRAALGRWPGRADAASGRSGPAARPNDRPGTGRPAHRRPAAGWPLRRLDRAQGPAPSSAPPMAAGDATPAAIPAWRPPEPGTYWRACWDR